MAPQVVATHTGGASALSSGSWGRARWTLLDQVISSVTNFLVVAAVAKATNVRELGGFAIAFAVYLVALGVTRSVTSEILLIRFSASNDDAWRAATRAAAGLITLISLPLSLASASAGLLFSGSLRSAMLTLAVVLPGLLIQDLWRYAFVARGVPRDAAANDAIWATSSLLGVGLATVGGAGTAAPYLAAWGLGAGLASVAGGMRTGVFPALTGASAWLKSNWDLGRGLLGEFLVVALTIQTVVFAVGAVAGLDQAGVFRAGQVIFGPVMVLLMGMVSIAVSEGARVHAQRGSITRRMALVSLCLVVVTLAWSMAVAVIPLEWGEGLLGSAWGAGIRLHAPLTIAFLALGAIQGPAAGIRVLGQTGRSFVLRATLAPLQFAGAAVGAALGGAEGAAWGMCLPLLVGVAAWWRVFLRLAVPCGERMVEVPT